jgi:membrane-bound metal-dependent hydrolase YbcI (DUF457 family)
MFIGHFGAGFGAKKFAPTVSLGTLFLAAQWADLIWPLLLLLGWEQVVIDPGNTVFTPLDFVHYPITHSLLAVLIWGAIIGGIYYFVKKNIKNSIWVGGLVVSHWILDLIVHRPDLPLIPGGAVKVGFGLWNDPVATVIVEGLIFILGIYFYIQTTRAKNRTGAASMWVLIIFLVIIYINNLFGPPPPSEQAIGIVGLSQWLLVAWAYWIDRNREIKNK